MSTVYLIQNINLEPEALMDLAKTITRGIYQTNPDVLLFDANTKPVEGVIEWAQEHGDAVVMNYETSNQAWWEPIIHRPKGMGVVTLMADTMPHFKRS